MFDVKRNAARFPDEELTRVLFEHASDLLAVVDREGRIELANPALCLALGLSRGEIAGQALLELVIPEDRIRLRETMRALCSGGGSARFETTLRSAQRSRVDVEGSLSCTIREADGASFHCIFRDISERRRLEQLKNDFVSTVSHELRTPLTSLHAALGMLQMGILEGREDEKRTLLEIAVANSERLIELINDLLDISRIEAGKMPIERKLVSLDSVVQAVVDEMALFAESRGAQITFHHRGAEATVRGDRARISQVLRNLLSNAVKFGGERSPIEVALVSCPGVWRVEVRDRGPGISDAFRPRLFEKFAQPNDPASRSSGGTGLGLSICKALVEAMEGTIGQNNRPEGGSTFFFELPTYEVPAIIRDSRRYAIAPPRFLVLDSDPDIAQLLKLFLRDDHVAVDLAFTADQARQLLEKALYDGLTLSLTLADETPAQFLATLRSSATAADLPVVVIGEDREIERWQSDLEPFAVTSWLHKPIESRLLRVAVARALGFQRESERPAILLVESDRHLSLLTSIALGREATLEVAHSVEEAKARLEREAWDLVLLDLDIDGTPRAELLSLLPIGARPVIVITAEPIASDTDERVVASFVKTRDSIADLLATVRAVVGEALAASDWPSGDR